MADHAQEHYERMVKPRRGDWVVVVSNRHFTQCDIGAGQVERVAGWKVWFFGSPLGESLHRLNRIWGIFPSEADARAAASKLRDEQRLLAQTMATAHHRFWRASIAAGIDKDRFSALLEPKQDRAA